jgi:hypothetical protein
MGWSGPAASLTVMPPRAMSYNAASGLEFSVS